MRQGRHRLLASAFAVTLVVALGLTLTQSPAWAGEAEKHIEAGIAFFKKSQYEDAITSFQEAIRLDPQNAEAHLWLRFTRVLLGVKTEFKDYLKKYEEEGILSKAEARTVFAMSEEEWIANVRNAVNQGVATATGNLETGISMAISTEVFVHMVRLMYFADKNRPSAIQVVAGYRPPYSNLLSDEKLEALVEKAKKEMLPDYIVYGNIEKIEGGTAIFFIIEENR